MVTCFDHILNKTLKTLQVKAFGPGLQPTGVTVNKPTEFTIDARMAGKGHLKIYAQVWSAAICEAFIDYL